MEDTIMKKNLPLQLFLFSYQILTYRSSKPSTPLFAISKYGRSLKMCSTVCSPKKPTSNDVISGKRH